MAVGIVLQWAEVVRQERVETEPLSVHLTLRPTEAALLSQVLRNYLSDLRMEIAGTENYDLRQQLKKDEEVIKEFISRLDQTTSGAPARETGEGAG